MSLIAYDTGPHERSTPDDNLGLRIASEDFGFNGSAFIGQAVLCHDATSSRLGTMPSCFLHHGKYNKGPSEEEALLGGSVHLSPALIISTLRS